jgi:diadenylate cyclase
MNSLLLADTTVAIADFTNPLVVVDFSLGIVLAVVIDVGLFFFLKRLVARIYIVTCEVLYILAFVFGFSLIRELLFGAFLVGVTLFLFANMSDYRGLVANGGSSKTFLAMFHVKPKKQKSEYLFDRDEMYRKIQVAVLWLSQKRYGALITFERKDDLTNIMKNGSLINSPVTTEIIETIFYPGTRLHDGAIVIREDKIVAASVYYTPTNRPLTGKFGSRHRAAYGICETTDSVTIIVSEETGRISIAFQGELTPVSPDTFLRVFTDDMESETVMKPVGPAIPNPHGGSGDSGNSGSSNDSGNPSGNPDEGNKA